MNTLMRLRDQMPVTKNWIYLDHAAVAPLPEPTSQAIMEWLQVARDAGDVFWPSWLESLNSMRELGASLINAEPSEIALVPNTTSGINIVAEGIRWREGDNIVTLNNEFPSNLYPWLNLREKGVETRMVPADQGKVDVQRIEEACDENTRLISASWVGYASGWRIDIGEIARIARSKSALFLLDAIQGMGVFPIDVKRAGVDFLAADGHKWMLGPEGAGLLYVRKELLDQLRATGVGWNSVKNSFDFSKVSLELKPAAARFEGGSMNMAGFIGLGASLKLLHSCGLTAQASEIGKHVISVTDYACQQLREIGAQISSPRVAGHESGIVTFTFNNISPEIIRKTCLEAGIVLSCRGGGVRISPHAYITFDEISRLVSVIKSIRA